MQAKDRRHPYIATQSQQQRGFTITELLLVLVLIGVLSVISMPALKGFAATRRLKSVCLYASQLTHIRSRYGDNRSNNISCRPQP